MKFLIDVNSSYEPTLKDGSNIATLLDILFSLIVSHDENGMRKLLRNMKNQEEVISKDDQFPKHWVLKRMES